MCTNVRTPVRDLSVLVKGFGTRTTWNYQYKLVSRMVLDISGYCKLCHEVVAEQRVASRSKLHAIFAEKQCNLL